MEKESEITEIRIRHITLFTAWMMKSSLSPLDYELVEERSSEGVTVWYFRKRVENEEIQTFENIGFDS